MTTLKKLIGFQIGG